MSKLRNVLAKPALMMIGMPLLAVVLTLSGCNGASDGTNLNDVVGSTTPTPTPTPTPAAPAQITFLLSSTNVSATSSVNVSVRALDANNVLMSGQTVTLSASSGTISNVSNGSITDSNGSVTFNVSPAAGAASGTITITAAVGSVSSTASVNIIGNSAASVKLGTSNVIAAFDSTRYEIPYNVLVTDSFGNPITNTTVNLTIVPVAWYQGYSVQSATAWAPKRVNAITCTSGGDCNPATISPSTTLTTDSMGYVTFNVLYAKNFAGWADVKITASTTLAGGPTSDTASFSLPGLSSDYTNLTVAPPGQCSPFNSSATQFGGTTGC